MMKEFKYRPPIKYILIGLSSVGISLVFFKAIGRGEIWLSLVVGFFGLICLTMGAAFTIIFINKISILPLRIGHDFIEIPGRWKRRKRIEFKDITGIEEIDTYDHVLEIYSRNGNCLIERNWMRRKEFYELRDILRQSTQ